MKIRYDYVTNSSSSSFVLAKNAITDEQKQKIYDYEKIAPQVMSEDDYPPEGWGITEDEYFIRGNTWIDNFNMCKFLTLIGVPQNAVEFKWS